MKQYVDLLQRAINEGDERHDRTGVGTRSIFGGQVSFDLRERFPLVTFKKTRWQDAFYEMLWFLQGSSNIAFLKLRDIKIWDAWADEKGELGPVYGVQWRKWKKVTVHEGEQYCRLNENGEHVTDYTTAFFSVTEIDQIARLINSLKNNPHSRRHIVTAWNPADVDDMALPPCHRDFQCYVSNDGHLDLMMAQRSWDLGLGAPYNIAQYAMLTHIIARAVGLKARHLKINYGDAHVYSNHIPKLLEWFEKYEPIDCNPRLIINTDNTNVDGYTIDDFDIDDYVSNPFCKLQVAV